MTYVTTAGAASAWSFMTNEQPLIHQALARRGIGYRTLEQTEDASVASGVDQRSHSGPCPRPDAVSPGADCLRRVQSRHLADRVCSGRTPGLFCHRFWSSFSHHIVRTQRKQGQSPCRRFFRIARAAHRSDPHVNPARQPRTSTTTRPCTSPFRMARPNSGSPARPTGRIIASSRSIGRSAAIRSQACTRAA